MYIFDTYRKQKSPNEKNNFSHLVIPIGTPGGARTPNNLIRSQGLYPIELRVHIQLYYYYNYILS